MEMEMEEEKNVFTAKTVDEAIALGLQELNVTLSDADIEILEEGKKGLFRSVKARVKITKKQTDGGRAVEFINGMLGILGINGTSEVVSEEDNIEIEIKSENSARVIGKRGDVLDAIQTLAGAAANIGREEYKKVVVDCENYRTQREETLKNLAAKVAAKAVETGRKVILEPMNPYERRIIHAALAENTQVKTISEGDEPVRHIVVIPEGAKPYDRGIRYGERKPMNGRDKNNFHRGEKRFNGKRDDRREGGYNKNRDGFKRNDRRSQSGSPAAKRAKKEIYFGTYLGNSNDTNKNED